MTASILAHLAMTLLLFRLKYKINVNFPQNSKMAAKFTNFSVPNCAVGKDLQKSKKKFKQECIPVGCVPSAAVAVLREGGVCPGGVVYPGGVIRGCLPRWVCQGGVCLEACLLGVGGCTPPPPMNRITDMCKKLPFRNFVCGR